MLAIIKATNVNNITPTKAPVVSTKPSTGVSNYASEVLRLVNVERAKAGLAALTTNTPLTNAAINHVLS